ncbi:MAG: patatin-like phospholipase family protein, partial [Planctomycetales bacterium]
MSNSDETIKKYYKYKTVDGDAVIRDELDRLTRRRSRSVDEELLPETAPTESEDVSESLTGLALSGGGIRSGALGLGILQTLHRSGLLPFFDYLSTVSGGGYAGAYVTSAGSHNRNHAEDDSAHSKSHDDSVPYGRLKAFHDGEGLSERMQQFIFGGHYLLRTRRFFNRYLMGLLCIWFMTVTGLSTLAALAAILFRQLDAPLARHFLVGLGFRTDISRGFVPVMLLLVLWLVCWCISFFRASGNLARAQGRFAAKLIPVTVVTFGICLAALLGNGEFSLDWLSNPKSLDIAKAFSSAEKFFQIAIYGVIGIGLLPFLKPAALIRSGASPKSASDRVVFAVASRVVLYGLPFLVVSWFARENISDWTEHRFVTKEIHEAGLRGKRNDESENDTSTSGGHKTSGIGNVQGLQPPKPWNDFVALTRSEIAGWSDWQPAWAPFWTRLRAEAKSDELARTADAKKAEEAARVARAERTTRAVIALEQAMADSTAAMAEPVQQGESKQNAADELATALAAAEKAVADTTKAAKAAADDAVAKVEGVSAAQSAKDAAVKAEIEGRTERDTKDGRRRVADGLVEMARVTAIGKEDDAAKAKRAAENSKRRIAEFIWERLDTRIRVEENDEVRPGQIVNLPWVPGNHDEPVPPSGFVTFTGIEDVITRIHKESLALQELYACTDQKTDDYAPDGPHLVLDRLLSLASLGPDSLRGAAKYNSLGKFVLRRQRLTRLRNWLADHLSRILETTNLGEDCDWSEPDNTGRKKPRLETLTGWVEQAALMSERHKSEDLNKEETGSTEQESGFGTGAGEEVAKKWSKQTLSVARVEAEARAKEEAETKAEAEVAAKAKEQEFMQDIQRLSHGERRDLARLNRRILDAAFPETLRDPSTVFASSVLDFDQARRWSMFWWCLGLFVVGGVMININATTLHSFYARELANNWIHSDKDSDHALSAADATDQCLPYHIFSGSVHWVGKRNKPAGDMQRDHFLFSPLYCGCEKTGFVSTSLYKDDELGLGDAIAISGAAVSPIQHGNPLLQALLWLSNLRLGQWLPNPNHGTFLPTKSRKLVARTPVTPLRILWRVFQVAERRPFVFVTDGGHHENLGIGPLLKRRCRFILAIDGGEDSDYSFTDLSRLMRWARVKHNVRLQPVDSHIEPTDSVSGGALATTVAGKTDAAREVRSAID